MSWNNCNNSSTYWDNCCTCCTCCGCVESSWPTSYCTPSNSVCANTSNPCPTVFYSASTGIPISVPPGGQDIPAGTIIPRTSTTVPDNTVTVVNIWNSLIALQGGITINNGFFTVPCNGQYLVTGVACFDPADGTATGDYRKVIIYKVDSSSGLVTVVAEEVVVPIFGTATCLNISYIADLKANDRIFMAVRQVNGPVTNINLNANSRIAIKRLC